MDNSVAYSREDVFVARMSFSELENVSDRCTNPHGHGGPDGTGFEHCSPDELAQLFRYTGAPPPADAAAPNPPV